MVLRNKGNFKIVVGGVDIILYVVENFELDGSNSIIINESASGDSGVTYNTGRLQESVPVNGILLAEDSDDLINKIDVLFKIKDSGEIVQFVTPYAKQLRTNQYYIKNVHFTFNPGITDHANFSIVLTENRQSNVKKTQENLVNYNYAEYFKGYYKTITGQTA